MHDRLLTAVGSRTYRHVGELTGTHPETVRRYLQGQAPSVEFVAALSKALNINADWILTGRGPMKCEELKAHALATADTSELLTAMSDTLERLIDRVERVEVYMQTLESRVRATQDEATPPAPAERPRKAQEMVPSRHLARSAGRDGRGEREPGDENDGSNGGTP
ncbi:MAG: helix-turn-helix transcriptional regulator [Phycisphaeraceae bacterium]|nr:helix-turn-helix transcriptional regulator [Phycisphaerae bacterium]MBX3393295.1 helix-turn-helix transcriptional regulator [Phycisphaeraceae bacterium]